MLHRIPGQSRPADAAPLSRSTCPSWCVAPHGVLQGEEDWVHTSEPLPLASHVLARLCMTVHPETGEVDGPYVVVGSTEYTPDEANAAGLALQALAVMARSTTLRGSA